MSKWKQAIALPAAVMFGGIGGLLAAFGHGKTAYMGWSLLLMFGAAAPLIWAIRQGGFAPEPPNAREVADLRPLRPHVRLALGLMFLMMAAGAAVMLAGCLNTDLGHEVRPWIASVLGLPSCLLAAVTFLWPSPPTPRVRADAFGIELAGVRRRWEDVASVTYKRGLGAGRLSVRLKRGGETEVRVPTGVDGFSLLALQERIARHTTLTAPNPPALLAQRPPNRMRSKSI